MKHTTGPFEASPRAAAGLKQANQVIFEEGEVAMAPCVSDIRPFLRNVVVVGEGVDSDDAKSVSEQSVDEVRADEAGRAGDDNVGHQANLRFTFMPLCSRVLVTHKEDASPAMYARGERELGPCESAYTRTSLPSAGLARKVAHPFGSR